MPDIIIPKHNPDVVELPKAFQAPPEKLHYDQIDYASFDNNAALKRASDAMKFAWNEAIAINEFRANPHDEDRAATHDRKVREKVDTFHRSFAEKFDGARAGLCSELSTVEAELERQSGLKGNPDHFDAITSCFHGMKPEQRGATITELIEQGDGASLAILVNAPLFLTGLTAQERNAIKTRLFHKVNPKGLALRDQLKLAIERFDEASFAYLTMRLQLRAGTEVGAWRARAQQAALHAAQANSRNR